MQPLKLLHRLNKQTKKEGYSKSMFAFLFYFFLAILENENKGREMNNNFPEINTIL